MSRDNSAILNWIWPFFKQFFDEFSVQIRGFILLNALINDLRYICANATVCKHLPLCLVVVVLFGVYILLGNRAFILIKEIHKIYYIICWQYIWILINKYINNRTVNALELNASIKKSSQPLFKEIIPLNIKLYLHIFYEQIAHTLCLYILKLYTFLTNF